MTGNFDFLTGGWPALHEDAVACEANVFTAPRTSEFYARWTLEKMTKRLSSGAKSQGGLRSRYRCASRKPGKTKRFRLEDRQANGIKRCTKMIERAFPDASHHRGQSRAIPRLLAGQRHLASNASIFAAVPNLLAVLAQATVSV